MRRYLLIVLSAAAVVLGLVAFPSGVGAAVEQRRCALPSDASKTFEQAKPQDVALDPGAVKKALTYAQAHLRASVQIFRNDCRVGTGLLDPVTDNVPMQVFSSTKSVISLLTGIATDEHRIALDDPVGKYLPKSIGDAAHRAITIRQLLTETSGLDESILTEFASIGLDPDIAREAMAQPLTHKPGTHFEYSQRTPDLLSATLQYALGEDLQTFAQRELFGPLGIPKNSYVWLRDRAHQTYGYANLFIPPIYFARLGLLAQHHGAWNGKQIVSAAYLRAAVANQPTNPCYGFLFWHNGGSSCTGANIPHAQTVPGPAIKSAPSDAFAMVGALHQNNFMIPSLGITVTWTGFFGDTAPNLSVLLSASPASDLYYNFFRILLRGVRDVHVPDPGPYPVPPFDFDVNPRNYLNPLVLLRDLFPSRDCTVLVCKPAA